jgi:VanZ family protein
VLLLCLAVPLYAAVLEIAQLFIPGRSSEFIDFFASSAGAWAGIILAWLLVSGQAQGKRSHYRGRSASQNRARS